MAQKFLVSIDLNKNELQNVRLQNLGTAPASPVAGQIYYDSATGAAMVYNGTAWISTDPAKVGDASIPISKLVTNPLARSNHTGTQTASTISDFDIAVRSSRLDQMAAPTGAVSLNSQRITNLATPSSNTDAANKAYVDDALQDAAAGIDSKPSVRVISESNVTLSGLQTIDGITLVAGDRVLLVGQTTAAQNGVYVAAASAWVRAKDADQTGEITAGAFWFVEEGTENGKTQWRCNNTGTITLGTTPINIVQFGAAAMYSAGNGLALAGSVFSVKAKASGGLVSDNTGVYVDRTLVPFKFTKSIGDGAASSFTVTHNLGTQDVSVSVFDNTSKAMVIADVVAATVNTITVSFATPPTLNAYRVVVTG